MPASQAGRRGFESRLPLHLFNSLAQTPHFGEPGFRGNGVSNRAGTQRLSVRRPWQPAGAGAGAARGRKEQKRAGCRLRDIAGLAGTLESLSKKL